MPSFHLSRQVPMELPYDLVVAGGGARAARVQPGQDLFSCVSARDGEGLQACSYIRAMRLLAKAHG